MLLRHLLVAVGTGAPVAAFVGLKAARHEGQNVLGLAGISAAQALAVHHHVRLIPEDAAHAKESMAVGIDVGDDIVAISAEIAGSVGFGMEVFIRDDTADCAQLAMVAVLEGNELVAINMLNFHIIRVGRYGLSAVMADGFAADDEMMAFDGGKADAAAIAGVLTVVIAFVVFQTAIGANLPVVGFIGDVIAVRMLNPVIFFVNGITAVAAGQVRAGDIVATPILFLFQAAERAGIEIIVHGKGCHNPGLLPFRFVIERMAVMDFHRFTRRNRLSTDCAYRGGFAENDVRAFTAVGAANSAAQCAFPVFKDVVVP